jgi:preprotein translocase subunit YajC
MRKTFKTINRGDGVYTLSGKQIGRVVWSTDDEVFVKIQEGRTPVVISRQDQPLARVDDVLYFTNQQPL